MSEPGPKTEAQYELVDWIWPSQTKRRGEGGADEQQRANTQLETGES